MQRLRDLIAFSLRRLAVVKLHNDLPSYNKYCVLILSDICPWMLRGRDQEKINLCLILSVPAHAFVVPVLTFWVN